MPLLRDQHVAVRAEENQPSFWGPLLLTMLPWALVIGAWVWIARRARGSIGIGGPLQSILKGRPKRFERQDHVRVRFDDVAGLTNSKRDLQEVVEFLRTPERFQRLGGKLPARRAARRPARHRQDAPRARGRRRGRGAVLLRERLGVHPALRGRRRLARARSVRRGEGGPVGHRVHRRDRRRRAVARRGPRRGQRRARADAQPAPVGDGRLHAERSHRRHRRDQPPGRARPGLASARPLRPPRRRRPPGVRRAPRHPPRAHAPEAARAGRVALGPGARDAGLQRRGPGEPLQRGGAHRRATRGGRALAARLLDGDGQGPARRSARDAARPGRAHSAWPRTRRGTPSSRTSPRAPSLSGASRSCPEGCRSARRSSGRSPTSTSSPSPSWPRSSASSWEATRPSRSSTALRRPARSRICGRRPTSRSAWCRTTG